MFVLMKNIFLTNLSLFPSTVFRRLPRFARNDHEPYRSHTPEKQYTTRKTLIKKGGKTQVNPPN